MTSLLKSRAKLAIAVKSSIKQLLIFIFTELELVTSNDHLKFDWSSGKYTTTQEFNQWLNCTSFNQGGYTVP